MCFKFHHGFGVIFVVVCIGMGSARAGIIEPGVITAKLDHFAGVSGAPNYLTHANDGSDRLFVVSQSGVVTLIKNGVVQPTAFLDVAAAGVPRIFSGERGLLGLAFHPDFASSGSAGFGKIYTYTSETGVGVPDFNHPNLGNTADHHSVVREWQVDIAGNPDRVDTTVVSREVMRINQPQSNHNGGALAFGPDGNLYIALGDGGSGNDAGAGHTAGIGNAQDTSNVYGSILRIDPVSATGATSANGQYTIPTGTGGNPFVGQAGVDEIFAYGLRNPFRMSFDRMTGDLYAGDVGQGSREEIDLIVNGGNYGWKTREGTLGAALAGAIDPIAEYVHGSGQAVIGGFVYRGSMVPELFGKYVFGDLTGRLFYSDLPSVASDSIKEFILDPMGVQLSGSLHGFGEDADGELYLLMGNGDVLKIVPEPGSWAVLMVLSFVAIGRRWHKQG